jgi:EAL domain-containing protein (putative c-di-GMP-specific phosphodiesterase class I)
METTAEGVETQAQLDLVRGEGCTEAQGFYFSLPRPVGELAELLGSSFRATTASARERRAAQG